MECDQRHPIRGKTIVMPSAPVKRHAKPGRWCWSDVGQNFDTPEDRVVVIGNHRDAWVFGAGKWELVNQVGRKEHSFCKKGLP